MTGEKAQFPIPPMKQNLIVAYPDGREDVYPILDGQATLGSDAECEFGIQAPGVEPHHIVFSAKDNFIFVVNLCDSETARLNGAPLDGRRPFEIGDELTVGTVTVRLRHVSEEGEDLASSPDGIAEVAESIRRGNRFGWRGYKKILEKVAPFIAPEEAEAAEQQHEGGRRMMGRSVLAVISLCCLSWFFQSKHLYVAEEVAYWACDWVMLFSVLFLTARYRIRFAGRVFFPVFALTLGAVPPPETWTSFFDTLGWGNTLFIAPISYLLGWLYDFGAGCIFATRRRAAVGRILLLILTAGGFWAFEYYVAESSPISDTLRLVFSLPCLVMTVTYPLWAKVVRKRRIEEQVDVAFVAELASRRMGKRWVARTVAVLAVGMPLLLVLGSLGISERLVWEESPDLVVTEEDSVERLAWFWVDRGRYLGKNDFASSLIFQVPNAILASTEASEMITDEDDTEEEMWADEIIIEDGEIEDESVAEKADLVATDILARIRWSIATNMKEDVIASHGIASTNWEAIIEFQESEEGKASEQVIANATNAVVLTAFGQTVVDGIARVQANATNRLAYVKLLETLSPYRVHSIDAESFAEHLKGSDAQAFYLEAVTNRATFESGPNPMLYHAQVRVGVYLLSQPFAQRTAESIAAAVIPCLVLIVIGGFLLWKRSSDSTVGFWLGIGFTASAIAVFFAYDLPDGSNPIQRSLHYPLWQWAVGSPIGGLIAGWVAALEASGAIFTKLSYLSQSILFVLLCWPRPSTAGNGRWKRFFVFTCKALLSGLIAEVAFLLVSALSNGSFLLSRIAAIIAIGVFGALLRRRRRFDTEAPELGWMFFFAWLLLEIAILLPQEAFSEIAIVPASWWSPITSFSGVSLGRLIAGTAAFLGGALFLRLCLKRNFLSLMTANGFTFALFSFSVPILAAICNSLTGKAFSGSFLQSEQGERIASLAVIVLVLRPLWNMLGNLSRRLSVRNLVRVESSINATLETVLDHHETVDVRDEIFARLGELGLEGYAFYARSTSDSFDLILKNGWKGQGADSFQMSTYLRHSLGESRCVVDLNRLEQEKSNFFQSFELFRIGQRIHAACILPICLGKSVRAILATPEMSRTGTLPNNDVLVETINTLGLATVSSLGSKSE